MDDICQTGDICQICLENNNNLIINQYDHFCKDCLVTYIYSLNLSIDIQLADLDEWILTASVDKFNSGIIRFRNPKTNLKFNNNELIRIYEYIN